MIYKDLIYEVGPNNQSINQSMCTVCCIASAPMCFPICQVLNVPIYPSAEGATQHATEVSRWRLETCPEFHQVYLMHLFVAGPWRTKVRHASTWIPPPRASCIDCPGQTKRKVGCRICRVLPHKTFILKSWWTLCIFFPLLLGWLVAFIQPHLSHHVIQSDQGPQCSCGDLAWVN